MSDMFRVPESELEDESAGVPTVSRETLSAAGDASPSVCAHPGCQNGIVKTGRGRPPKYCDEHKSTKSRSNSNADSGTAKPVRGKWNRGPEIERILTTYIQGVGQGLQIIPALTADGVVIEHNMPNVIHELVLLADDDKRLRKYLEYLTAPGKYAPLTLACFSVIIPILANHDLLPKLPVLDMMGGEK